MFHNDGYANCDVAMHNEALSMGYARLSAVGAISRDYANPWLLTDGRKGWGSISDSRPGEAGG